LIDERADSGDYGALILMDNKIKRKKYVTI